MIRNLRVLGSITTSAGRASGFVGMALGDVQIMNCVSGVDIVGTGSGGEHAGFVSNCNGVAVTVTGSAFTGSITAPQANYCAGFLGWNGASVTNCVYAGTMVAGSECANFIRTTSRAANCYYMNDAGLDRVRGKQARAVAAAENVSLDFGTGTVYSVSGITAYGAGLLYGGQFYAGSGDAVTLTPAFTAVEGIGFVCAVNAGSITASGNVWTLAMPDQDVTVDARAATLSLEGTGAYASPWKIASAADWNLLSTAMDCGLETSGKYVRLTSGISVTAMVGTPDNPFAGTFDGGGQTLTFSGANTDGSVRVAPFAYTSGAVIRNLRTAGSITGTQDRASGLIGENGASRTLVENCRVSMSVSGKSFVAGFCIGDGSGGVTLRGCLFDGNLSTGTRSGGLVGWTEGAAILQDCFFKPGSVSFGSSCFNLYYNNYGTDTAQVTNSYWRTAMGTPQGQQAFSVTEEDWQTDMMIVNFGQPREAYGVSGISAYNAGIMYDGVFYAGPNDSVTLEFIYLPREGEQLYHVDCIPAEMTKTETENTYIVTGLWEDSCICPGSVPIFGWPERWLCDLPEGLTEIGEEAFAGAFVYIVDVPGTCGHIGDHAFRNSRLSQIRIPADCTLGEGVFDGCMLVYIYSTPGSPAEQYFQDHPEDENIIFVDSTTHQ